MSHPDVIREMVGTVQPSPSLTQTQADLAPPSSSVRKPLRRLFTRRRRPASSAIPDSMLCSSDITGRFDKLLHDRGGCPPSRVSAPKRADQVWSRPRRMRKPLHRRSIRRPALSRGQRRRDLPPPCETPSKLGTGSHHSGRRLSHHRRLGSDGIARTDWVSSNRL